MNRSQTPFTRVAFLFDGHFNHKGQQIVRYKIGAPWPHHSHIQSKVLSFIAKRLGTEVSGLKVVDAADFDSCPADSESLAKSRRRGERLLLDGVRQVLRPLRLVPGERDNSRPPRLQQSGVDVSLAVHATQLAANKLVDVVVLVAGDADFVPLVDAITAVGIPVVVAYYKAEPWHDARGIPHRGTFVSTELLGVATWSLNLTETDPLDDLDFDDGAVVAPWVRRKAA